MGDVFWIDQFRHDLFCQLRLGRRQRIFHLVQLSDAGFYLRRLRQSVGPRRSVCETRLHVCFRGGHPQVHRLSEGFVFGILERWHAVFLKSTM